MIKLSVFPLENDIEFSENYVNILEIENKKMFSQFVYSLNRIINYNEESEEVILLEGNKRLSISKDVMLIHDLFNIDVNESKILKALHLDIENQYKQEYSEVNLLEKFNDVIKNINDIISSYDFEFEYKKEITIKELLKTINFKFDSNYYDNPFDNIMCIFDLVSTFNLYKVIIVVNAKCYFEEEELEEIYKAAKYRNINLLIIEPIIEVQLKYLENKLSIDNDYDEFIFKM
ncbi:type II-A CRISPR-associated protein Csn2 [Clostridium algidicarnis]|uniref:type II-A CRISPR-associated protein Csn2 n=1 Tax=Clostridium algidicarnis TaxID=37659 RepID=UPI001C0D738F|nr:type II-A CRISPR-associated protein Csn2 [Clostridium algidicarnis]MBU3193411.1 type II-A CRISPR-associated protein Csn2 [Clostridium algidicarnis]